ncbi:MAG TPA: RHS repeat-associated core domain-containing protein [Blastocatellia bacterium]|nr:RHS repeat-associated core domain-containing protein [Blastocatellia bacterium]
MEYDAAGNQTRDTYTTGLSGSGNPDAGKRWYNADGKMTAAHDGSVWQRYRYDANGRRVKRLVGQTGANGEVWQVYDPDGLLLAEYPKQGAAGAPTKEYGYRGGQLLVVFDSTETGDKQLQWLVTDHLGSTRMLVNRSGSLNGIKRRDYLPFGEELAATIGHRAASGSGYAVDDKPRMKFTGHERDGESGLDYMQARYCSSVQGRFTSPDPVGHAGADESDPQSWNLYAYARSSPVVYTDPDGLKFRVCYDKCFDYDDKDWPKYKQSLVNSGFTVKDGKIYNDAGEQAGTYRRLSDDNWTDFQNGLFFGNAQDPGLAGRAQATKNAIYIVSAVNLTVPAAILTVEIITGAAFEGVNSYLLTVRAARPFSHLPREQLLTLLDKGKHKLIEKFFETGKMPEGLNTKDLKVYMEAAFRRLAEGKDISLRGGGNVQWRRIVQILKHLGEL